MHNLFTEIIALGSKRRDKRQGIPTNVVLLKIAPSLYLYCLEH